MKKTILLLLAFVLGFSTVNAAKHIIIQSNFTFTPDLITVNVGDTIRWEWTSGVHTTTTKNIPAGAPIWDSPLTASNPSFEYVVTLPGEYEYKCTPHESSGMTGKFETSSSTAINDYQLDFTPIIQCNCGGYGTRIISNSEMPYDGEISIYDISGRKVYETNASFSAGNCEMLIMDANINRGFYILQVLTAQKKRLSVKFYAQ